MSLFTPVTLIRFALIRALFKTVASILPHSIKLKANYVFKRNFPLTNFKG